MYESNHKGNKSTLQCTVHLYSLLIDYLMADFKHSQIRQLGAEIESISLLCLNAHCRVKFLCADLRFGLLRLSTMKKCPHMLRLDQRELVGGMRANTETSRSSARAGASTTMSILFL